ncbi:hypothetical protein KAR91_08205 [Candidatus Pacearchaeota archaeon]|nr:hypothetical protein [Candidatus Pacearchaeota archaeon]
MKNIIEGLLHDFSDSGIDKAISDMFAEYKEQEWRKTVNKIDEYKDIIYDRVNGKTRKEIAEKRGTTMTPLQDIELRFFKKLLLYILYNDICTGLAKKRIEKLFTELVVKEH